MLPHDAKLISVDDHLIEHSRVWLDRLPSKFRDAGPHIIETEGGDEAWCFEGVVFPQVSFAAAAGTDPMDWGPTKYVRYEDMRPGFYDPGARLSDMDLSGVYAQLCFPTFPGFAGTKFVHARDKALSLRCVMAYNDFMLEEWCGADPSRLLSLCLLPLWDVELSIRELERVISGGAKAISFVENPVPIGLPSFHSDHWNPLMARLEESGLPLCLHFGTSGIRRVLDPDGPHPIDVALVGTTSMASLTDILFSPLLHLYPSLKIVLSEGGIGWIPYILERIDYAWGNHKYHSKVNKDVLPSELFRSNVWGCFIDDPTGLVIRDRIGVDRILWESDYPHADSSWPHCRDRAGELLANVPDDESQKIVEKNARLLLSLE
jgi:predicted TIM-barrel fold metal-dependent hydrolase